MATKKANRNYIQSNTPATNTRTQTELRGPSNASIQAAQNMSATIQNIRQKYGVKQNETGVGPAGGNFITDYYKLRDRDNAARESAKGVSYARYTPEDSQLQEPMTRFAGATYNAVANQYQTYQNQIGSYQQKYAGKSQEELQAELERMQRSLGGGQRRGTWSEAEEQAARDEIAYLNAAIGLQGYGDQSKLTPEIFGAWNDLSQSEDKDSAQRRWNELLYSAMDPALIQKDLDAAEAKTQPYESLSRMDRSRYDMFEFLDAMGIPIGQYSRRAAYTTPEYEQIKDNYNMNREEAERLRNMYSVAQNAQEAQRWREAASAPGSTLQEEQAFLSEMANSLKDYTDSDSKIQRLQEYAAQDDGFGLNEWAQNLLDQYQYNMKSGWEKFWGGVGDAAMAGIGSVDSMFATVPAAIGDSFGANLRDTDYYKFLKGNADYYAEQNEKSKNLYNNYTDSKIVRFLNGAGRGAVEGFVQSAPFIMLAPLTAAKTALQSAFAAANYTAGELLAYSGVQMLKNPGYWLSFAQEFGNQYDDAIRSGVDPVKATISGLVAGSINGGIEMGFGVQANVDDIMASKGFQDFMSEALESAIEEGGEELAQGFTGNVVDWLVWDKDKQAYSFDQNANAILNVPNMWEEFKGGFFGSWGFGGVQIVQSLYAGARSDTNKRRLMNMAHNYMSGEFQGWLTEHGSANAANESDYLAKIMSGQNVTSAQAEALRNSASAMQFLQEFTNLNFDEINTAEEFRKAVNGVANFVRTGKTDTIISKISDTVNEVTGQRQNQRAIQNSAEQIQTEAEGISAEDAYALAKVGNGEAITEAEAQGIVQNEAAAQFAAEKFGVSSEALQDAAAVRTQLNDWAAGVRAITDVMETAMRGDTISFEQATAVSNNAQAREYVASRLGIQEADLTDPETVRQVFSNQAAEVQVQQHRIRNAVRSEMKKISQEHVSLHPATGRVADGDSVRNVTVHDFADAKAGTVYTEDGGTVKLDSVAFDDSDVAAAYQQARRYDTDTANIFINGFRGQEGYAAAFDHLFRMGQQGVAGSISSEYAKMKDAIDLTTALAAYGRGKQNDTNARAITRTENAKGGGVVKDYNESKLSRQQKASVEMVDTLGKILGVTFVVHETGRFKTGGIVLDLNGFFNQNDNTVHLSLNSVDGLILRTAGHELTHFMKKWNQEGYEAYRDVLKEEIGEERWEQMIRKQQEIHKENTNRVVSREYAEEEVVADASERYLNDIETFKKLADRNRTAAQKLLDALKEFIQKIRDAFSGKRGVYSEQSTVLSQLENFEQIRDQWADALGEAAERFRNTEQKENAASDGDVKFSVAYQQAEENSELLKLGQKVEAGNFRANEKVYLKDVSAAAKERISNIVGFNVSDYRVAIEARMLDHILNRHGKTGTQDHSLANLSDLAKLEYALKNYSDIRPSGRTQAYTEMVNGKNRTDQTVLYEAPIGEKSYYVVQAVPNTKAKTIYIVSAFIGAEGYKKETSQLINAQRPDATSVNGSADVSGISIRNSHENVKQDAEDIGASRQAAEEENVSFSLVTDQSLLRELEDQEHVTVYRAMQEIDGKLYPPMAAKVASEDGKTQLVQPTEIGSWYQSDERPDLIKNGKFTLNKGNGSSIAAAYNPYFHTSASPLNDQFSSAYKRPNLVVVQGVIPRSELTSGYKAEGAKDAVGETKWHAGPVASKLKGDKARRVFLSRYFKAERIVSDAEVARTVAGILEGENIAVPRNVVTPSLLSELRKQGVKIEGEQDMKLSLNNLDSSYLSAVESGDVEEQQRLVDEAAERLFADSKIRDEDGNLLKVYHGTDADFTVFDRSKGRSTMDIQGSFFSPWDIDAGGYGSNVRAFYLNITNPAPEGIAYRALNRFKGQNEAGIKAREYLESQGYDGVNNGDEEYIAFRSEQIKSADPVTYDDAGNVIPLSERFNPENEDIRFSINEALGDEYEEYQGRALVTEDTLDRWLKDYAASNPNYAQAYITYMTPDQFLRLTTTDAVSRSRIRSQSEGLTVQSAVEYSREQPVQLMIDTGTGKVEGHEGRHRMVAFDRAGIRKIPVLLFDSRNKYSKTAMDSLKLIGQDFNGRTNTDIETVQNVQPLSRGNRENLVSQFSMQTGTERVSERYGRQNVRFSINEDDFKNITHVLTGEKLSSEYVSALVELQNGRPITSEQYNAIPEIRQAKERLGAAGNETIRINTPERNRQRQKWATDLLDKFRSATVDKSGKTVYNGDVEQGRRLDIVIGLPSSGKSSAVVDPLSYEHKSRLLDSDEAKKLIPEFDGGWGAGRVHDESQFVMREALDSSMQHGDNIVLPIVGAKLENVEKYLNKARNYGYTCYVHLNDLNPYKAMGRNLQRFATRGKFVDLDATSFRYGNGPREVFDDYVRRYGNGTARLLSADGRDRGSWYGTDREGNRSGNDSGYLGRTQTQRAGESPSLISGYTEISNDVQRGSMPVQVSGTEQINFNWKREARANAEQKNSLNESGRQDSEISPQLKEVMPRRDYEFYQMREELKASRLREDNLSTTVKTQENIIAGLREEFELTKGHKLKQQTINRLAQRLVKQYNSTYNVQELSENLGKLFDYIANGENLDWDSVMEISSTISKRILEESSTLNRELYDQYKGMRDYFRTQKISIPQDMRAEVSEYFGGWNNLRRQLFGRVNLVNNGVSLDSHWNEICDAWPEFFDREAVPQEQVTQVINALDAIQPFHENPYGMNMDEAAYDLAQEIYEDYFSVPEVKTFADRQQQKLEQTIAHMTEMRNREKQRIKDRYEQKLSDLRKQKGEQMAALRERYEKAIGQDREMYRQRLERLRAQKNEQLMRQQAKLRTEKMEAVHRQRDLRQAAYYKQRINRILQEFNQRLLSPTKEKHIPSKLISSMVEVCEIMNGAYDNAKARLALEDLQAAYSEMRAHEGTEENPFFDPVVADIAHLRETLAERQVKELSVADLKDVYDVLREVRHVVNTYNKAFVQGRKATISGYATDVMGEMNTVRKSKAALNNKVLDALKAFGWQNLKPIYAMRMIGSDTLTELYHNLRAGEDTWAVNVGKVRDVLLKARQKYGYNSWNTKAERTFRLQNGGTITLDLGHMMSMYALYKRQQAVAHMEQGGVVLDSESSKRKATAAPVQITFADMQQIVDAMTDNQRAFVDEMQRYLSVDMAALGNEVTRALYDIEKFTDPNYFPIKSSSDFIYNAQDKKEAAPKLINSSFTKDVVRFANNPVIISDFTDVWADHCNQMCMFNAMTLPLEDFTRVFNFKTSIEEGAAPVSVKTTLTNEFGGSKDAISYIEHMLRDVNGGVVNQAGVAGINKLVSLFKKGAVFASASVVIQQPSAVARALAIIDPKYFLKTSFSWGLYNEAMQWAPIARIKEMGYFDTGISRGPVEWITKSDPHGLRERVKAFLTDGSYRDDRLSIAPQKADAITWSHIWAACKAEQLEKGHFARNSEEHMRATAKRFTEVVERTQVYDSVFSRSEMMRSKDTGAKMVTAFMAEPTTSFNMLLDGFVQGKRNGFTRKGWAYTTRAAGAFVASVVLNAILKSFVTASRDDDDDKSYWEKYLGNVVGNIKDDINPLGLIPIARDIISIFQGYSVDRADMSLFEDLAKNFKKFQQMQEKGEADANTIMGFVGSLAAFLGLPVKNIWRDIKSVMNVSRDFFVNKNETDWNGIVYSIAQELGYDMSYKALAQQMLSGSSQAERTRDFLLQSGKTEDKINTEVRKYLSSDKTFQAYAEKYAGGELSALEDAIDHFESLGFNGEDVASALRTYADKTVNGKESSYTGTVAGTIYQYDDLFTAMESGNSADVTKIVNAIAEGYQASGKTLKEAKSTIRSQLTKNFKEQYIAADERERLEIRRMLNGTAVYDSLEALDKILDGWLKG